MTQNIGAINIFSLLTYFIIARKVINDVGLNIIP